MTDTATRPAAGPDLAELADRFAIRELTARYNDAIDDGRLDDYFACFTPDGVLEVVGLGRAQGADQIRPMVESISPIAVHLTLDAVVEVDGDTATQRCRFLLGRRSPDGSDFTVVTSGRYRDRLVRTPAGWRFAERHATFDIDTPAVIARLQGG
ncbi:MAG: nuclear transport factor 2 family protein [Actinomycetota bacterium]|jgi:3-phenylpropionate/cinnamic acid dioxygenase small subunit